MWGVLAVALLALFFITSADSASTVMGSMSQHGQTDANRFITAGWGILVALVGMTMLLTGGDDILTNLQNITIVAASPFLIVIFLLMFALVKDLRNDEMYLDYREQQRFATRLARERRIHREAANHAKAANSVRRLITDRGGKRLKISDKEDSSKEALK